MKTQRIAPVENPDEEVTAILDQTAVGNERGEALNIFRTLAHHPRLLRRFNGLGGAFMTRGLLEPRLRELVILRVAWLSRCDYEWGQHVVIAEQQGIPPAEIEALTDDLSAGHWSEQEKAALMVTGRLIDDCSIEDDLWAALTAHFSAPELLELLMLIGFYRMTAGVLNAVAVTRETWLPALPEEQ